MIFYVQLEDYIFSPGRINRKPEPIEIPPTAIIVKSYGEPLFPKSTRPKKKNFRYGLGTTPKKWVKQICDGKIMATLPLDEKVVLDFDEFSKIRKFSVAIR